MAGVSSARVELVDLDALAALPDWPLLALRDALRASGLDDRFLARLARVGERLDDPLRAPMRAWNARRMPEPAAVAARLFVLHDPVPTDQAAGVLGDLAPLLDASLLELTGDGILSRARLAIAGTGYVFGDRSATGEGVPPFNAVTAALAAAGIPRGPLGAALDLGCGAGALALALARKADRVIATDVSPRAVAWTLFNARLDAAGDRTAPERIEVRRGDLYEPVRGARFDVILSQPPFVARRAGALASTFAHGGERGDDLARRAIAGAAAHLTATGRAVFLADWPLVEDDPLEARVRAAIAPDGADAVVLASPSKNLDEYCASVAAAEHPVLDDAFARAAWAQRDHFERLGVRGVAQALVVLAAPGGGRVATFAVKHGQDAPLGAEAVERFVARAALARALDSAVLGARLRVPVGTRFVEQPSVQGVPPAVIVQLPAASPEWPFALAVDAAAAVRAIDAAPTVLDAARASGTGAEAMAAVARDALRRGALHVAG